MDSEVTVVIQINGKVRAKLELPADLGKDEMQARAMELDRVKELLEGKDIKKVIAVPGKLVNIVAK